MKKVILLSVFCTLFLTTTFAQVTIGSEIAPEKVALLDIKTKNGGAGLISSEGGGILFPRVDIVDSLKLTKLNVFNDAITGIDTETEGLKHRGLTVYNIGSGQVRPGIYTWDGQRWRNSAYRKELNFFYMPSIEIPLTNIQPIDLHAEYVKQFSKPFAKSVNAPASLAYYQPKELYYYVIGVGSDNTNPDIFDTITISEEGKMTYTVKSNLPDDVCCSYINIVFVVK